MKSRAESAMASRPFAVGKGARCFSHSYEDPWKDQLIPEFGKARREALVGKLLLTIWEDGLICCFWRATSSLPRAA